MQLQVRQVRTDYPPELKAQIANFLRQHVPQESTTATIDMHTAAQMLNVQDPKLIYRIASNCGITLKRKPHASTEKNEIHRKIIAANADKTAIEVAKLIGESYAYVRSLCDKYGLELKPGKSYTRKEEKEHISIFSFDAERLFIGSYIF
jgi:predicted glycoside hydrolase/deacetylase ChbG (UPF0249 family)